MHPTAIFIAALAALLLFDYLNHKSLNKNAMKTFQMKANLLAGLTHTINSLAPQQKADCLGGDPVDANRLAVKAVADCEEANRTFLDATKATFDKKSAALAAAKEKLAAEQAGKSDAEQEKIGSDANAALKQEVDKIDKESTANADEIVVVTISDDKLTALQKLIRPAVSQWQDSALYVETATALDEAKDA